MDFTDDYSHDLAATIYFPRSIPTREVEENHDVSFTGCNCVENCNNCPCIERSGISYSYTNLNDLETYRLLENDQNKPAYECNDNCKCWGKCCGNRLVQYGPRTGLKVYECNHKGLGLFASEKINPGNFICEYAGEIIAESEALQRFTSQTVMNYIFCINEQFGGKNVKTFIDPKNYGNIGRYINHSCEANCNLHVIRQNSTIPALCIFANQLINEGEEITFDYGHKSDSEGKNKRKKCFCGSKNCRKYLPFDISL